MLESPNFSPSQELLALLEAKAKKKAKNDFETWCKYVLLPQGMPPAKHHLLLIRELQAVADGYQTRLMIFLPPGSGKSTFASRLFPAFWFSRFPRAQIIAAANTQTLADKFSYDVQALVRDHAEILGYGLETEAKNLWHTSRGGLYRAAGVGAQIIGFRGNLAILDDLVPDAEGADSTTQREALWNWYVSGLSTRMTPGAPIVLVMTRWNEDDIAGRLLRLQGSQWRVISIPALAEESDPLDRIPGEPLWDDDSWGYGAQMLAKRDELHALGQSRAWWALYQQQPQAPEGAMFHPERVVVVDQLPPPTQGSDVRAWDLAATAAGGDATVGVRLRKTAAPLAPRFGIVDVVRLRGSPDQVVQAIIDTAWKDGTGVTIRIPQDPGQAGKQQVTWLTGQLGRYRVVALPVTGSKENRAGPAASQMNAGNFDMVRAEWNAPLIAELKAFPNGREDDQVDALADAYTHHALAPQPLVTKEALEQSRLPRYANIRTSLAGALRRG